MIRRLPADHTEWAPLLRFLQTNFAYMTPLMGHPPRINDLSPEDLADRAAAGAAWVVGPDDAPTACLFARPSRDIPGALFLHMLAVDEAARGQGLANRLTQRAEAYARSFGFETLTLDTGAALTELCAYYRRQGFEELSSPEDIVTFTRALPTLERLAPGDNRLDAILALLHAEFAVMEGRIDPPSSLHRLTRDGLSKQAVTCEIWGMGDPLVACMILTPEQDALYLGKLAVSSAVQCRGLARQMVEHAGFRALTLGLDRLRLETRIELTENHAAFAAMGFEKTGETAHPGFDRPTSVTMERRVGHPLR